MPDRAAAALGRGGRSYGLRDHAAPALSLPRPRVARWRRYAFSFAWLTASSKVTGPTKTRSRISQFMNKFRKLGLIDYNGQIVVHNSLLNVVLNDNPHLEDQNGAIQPFVGPDPSTA